MADGDELQLVPEDDDFHDPGDDVWHAEGSWQNFFVPERGIDVWLYHIVHQNVGTVSGGCWVWDHTAHRHDEVLYYANFSGLPLPAERDLRRFTFPSGVTIEALDPLTRYRMSYTDGDLIAVDVEYEAAGAPWASAPGQPEGTRPTRFEQPVRARGELVLHGEKLPIDCYCLRDHSWGRRPAFTAPGSLPEVPPAAKAARAPVYYFAIASPDDQLFVMAGEGYLTREGVRATLRSPTVAVERDEQHGHIARMEVEGTDDLGRHVRAVGEAVSPMLMPLTGSHSAIWNILMRWTLDNGVETFGEIQDTWPYRQWAEFQRSRRLPATEH